MYYEPEIILSDKIIVWVHGGGWNAGNPKFFDFVGQCVAGQGYRFISLGYRLSPKYKYPCQIQDVCGGYNAAVHYLKERGINPSKIIAAGPSAGAHLTSIMCYCRKVQRKYDVDISNIIGFIGSGGPYRFGEDNSLTLRLSATCSLDLRQSNYSARKSRTLPADLFRGNGRVYHELLEIEVPHLLTIHLARMTVGDQKSKDRYDHKEENFVVQIYRNQNVTGGEAFEEYIFPYQSEAVINGQAVRMDLGNVTRCNIICDWLFNGSSHTSYASHRSSMELFAGVHTLTAGPHNAGTSMGCRRIPQMWSGP